MPRTRPKAASRNSKTTWNAPTNASNRWSSASRRPLKTSPGLRGRDAARAAIAEDKGRADAQEQRANNAVAAATELERTLRIEFAGKLQQQASEHQQALDDARTDYDQRLAQAARDTEAAVQRAREEVEAARAGDRREHAEQIGQLNQQLGALTQRAEGAETGQREQAGLLSELRAAVAAALAALGEDGDDLRQQYQHLVQEQ
jgi:hypothetical protein